MMQNSVEDQGGTFAFCDTDSMSIADLKNDNPEKIGQDVIEKFKALVPYDRSSLGKMQACSKLRIVIGCERIGQKTRTVEISRRAITFRFIAT